MRDVVEPTRRLLGICDRHGAKMTIMFEVGEYWAFARYDRQLREDLGFSPSEQMRTQAMDAIEHGHDVQLHLHPQWIDAEYDRGAWQLNHSCWRLADLPGGLGSKGQTKSITGALHAGRQTLEDMLKPVKGDYKCIGFRAGGFYAQPSAGIIAAMKEVGLRVDSSVVKGYRTKEPFAVDYSGVEIDKRAWWTTSTEFTREGKAGENILELPVSAQMQPYWKNCKVTKFCAALKRWKAEKRSSVRLKENSGMSSVPKYTTVLKKLFGKHANTFDFCKLSSRDMLSRMRGHTEYSGQPAMLIGHSKDFYNDRHFDLFLARMSQSDYVKCQTMSEFIEAKLQAG